MIKITQPAIDKLVAVLIDADSKFLRIGIKGGGCNGFSYFFQIDEPADDDTQIQLDKEKIVIVDSISLGYLNDAEIDYQKDLMGESFVFRNPNTTGQCGCGNSVSF